MRSSQGAATSDLAVHRTLRVGFSPVAAAARCGAALGRRGAIHALSRRRADGCPRPSAEKDRQTASMLANTRRCMALQQQPAMDACVWESPVCRHRAGSAGCQCGQRRSSTSWSNGIQTWMTGPRIPKLSQSHRNYASETFWKPPVTFTFHPCLLVSYMPLAASKTAPDAAICCAVELPELPVT